MKVIVLWTFGELQYLQNCCKDTPPHTHTKKQKGFILSKTKLIGWEKNERQRNDEIISNSFYMSLIK